MAFTLAVAWVYLQPLRQDSVELRATSRLPKSLQEEPPVRTVATLVPNLRIGSKNAKHFSEPPVRFELTAYALRVRCSTPELRWLVA